MCGRFAIKVTWEELEEWYSVANNGLPRFPENYNISPTQPIAVIGCFDEADKTHRELTFARWGLIPFWWKKPLNELPSSINARAEGIETKPFYRSAFRYRRCLVPASGFYEWKGSKSPKQPYYISSANRELITFAGIYEHWTEPRSGSEVLSVSIITTQANNFMKPIHKRMPVLLTRENFQNWLHGSYDNLLKPCPDNYLRSWPVSTRMNSARYNMPDCIEPLEDIDKLI